MNKAFIAFILGIAAGILNVLFAAAATLDGGLPEEAGRIAAFISVDIVCLLNFIGACICRTKRTAGGALMLSTALPLLTFMVLGITSGIGAAVLRLFPEAVFAVLAAELVSIAAAVLCFAPADDKRSDFYYEHDYVHPGVPSAVPGEDNQLGKLVQDLYKQPANEESERSDNGAET